MSTHEPVSDCGEISLPNGCTLYWKLDPSVNCREYFSDEIGGGVHVWNTALVDRDTLLAAIVQEARLRKMESESAEISRRAGRFHQNCSTCRCVDPDDADE